MASRSMNLDVLVRLKDSLSGGLRRMTGSLQAFGKMARNIGLVGTAIAAISFMGPIKEAAAFQQSLLDIAGTANLTGGAAYKFVDDLKLKYEGLALAVSQTSETIAGGAGQMIAAGVDPKLIDASIGNIGRAATAANAEFNDMASVATSMLTTLQMPADQLNNAMGGLVVAGKEGAFELKDMAKYFPTLTSQMTKFGVKGREAVNFLGAALQIARKGTADPAEAANNLKNFLAKILAPATIKNFKDAGVNIEAVMRDAATKGINPIEAVMQKIVKLTGVSGTEIAGLMKKAKDGGLEGADALAQVREQLVKIHGAGALGDLFADMQVMDFLIPFLSNIDEYKRIKSEVAKATGAVIDGDFETQMDGLNRQLITFGEIGTQASREVGFAFGSWLPMINENLAAALKWLRELDASTGGMVRQALAMSGAGILFAGALGVLGLVLPVVAAGLSALSVLLGPVGLALAAVGAGAAYIYKNWATFGPRATALWGRAKAGFFELADGMKQRGQRVVAVARELIAAYGPALQRGFERAWAAGKEGFASFVAAMRSGSGRIIAAGQEMVDRYSPIIVSGFNRAWEDVEVGWNNLQKLFEGFKEGLDLNIDFSGMTFDDAKLAVFRSLDDALKGIATSWDKLKGFGSSFAPFMESMGKDAGGSMKAAGEFAKNMASLADTLLKMGSAPKTEGMNVIDVDKIFGNVVAEQFSLFLKDVRQVTEALAALSGKIADLAATIQKGIDWSALLPTSVIDTWNKLAAAINSVKSALAGVTTGAVVAPGDTLPNGVKAGNPDDGSDRGAATDDYLAPPIQPPAANNNKQSSLSPAQRGFAAPVKTASLSGTVNVVVKGVDGATIISSESNNPAVKVASTNTGRAVGRV